jgi:hypothetical protein
VDDRRAVPGAELRGERARPALGLDARGVDDAGDQPVPAREQGVARRPRAVVGLTGRRGDEGARLLEALEPLGAWARRWARRT